MKSKEISLKREYEVAKDSDNKIDKLLQITSISYLYLGAELKRQKKEKLYKYLGKGPEYESFESYIKSKRIELRKAYYLIQIYTIFVEELKFKPEELVDIPWTSLRVLVPIIKKENAVELVEKARVLTRGHLETEIKQLKSGIHSLKDLEKHEHEWERITYWRCRICGETQKRKPTSGKIII